MNQQENKKQKISVLGRHLKCFKGVIYFILIYLILIYLILIYLILIYLILILDFKN